MIKPNGLMMIEPTGIGPGVLGGVSDELARKMAAALRQARKGPAYRGVHTCKCGVHSGNTPLYVNLNGAEVETNSLAVHYLVYHRDEVPAEELAKVAALEYGVMEGEFSADELKPPMPRVGIPKPPARRSVL